MPDQLDENIIPAPENEGLEDQDTEATDNEQDMDDIVHNVTQTMPKEDEEIDADETVHKMSSPLDTSDDSEKDPDDMVHGQ